MPQQRRPGSAHDHSSYSAGPRRTSDYARHASATVQSRAAARRAGARRAETRRGPQGLVTCLALMIGVAVSVWIVVSPTSHADGLSQPKPVPAKAKPLADQHLSAAKSPKSPNSPTSLASAAAGKKAAPPNVQRWPYADRCPEKALACVDLKDKVSWLQINGVVMYGPVQIEPGSPGQVTPKGVFTVNRKDKHHISNEFNEPMPDAIFFAPGGIAFHVGSLTQGSHGCVHLTTKDANYYFDQLRIGATVAVY